MQNTIYFYTGTGNSLWTARNLGEKLGNTELIPIPLVGSAPIHPNSQRIGLVFPVHIWGIPGAVIDFINLLKIDSAKYYFAIAVNAGQVAATLLQLKDLLKQRQANLAAGFSICLPSNYIPWGGAVSEEKQKKKFNESLIKIDQIAKSILANSVIPPEHGLWLQNIILSALYRLSAPRVPKMDKSFFADDKCTGCNICEKICPAQNISMSHSRPSWHHHCQQCFACLQWCPEDAIQYGKNTAKKKRYHHPEIKLADMLSCIPKN
jgi:Pyruvate/2-oxoacid:ferredoxin oxidoreductase delta subunit